MSLSLCFRKVISGSMMALVALCHSSTGWGQSSSSVSAVELGKMLFFDKRLSKDGSISCNSCHNISAGGTDNLKLSKGINGHLGSRNSPTVFNAKFYSVQFWDGRAKDLSEQAKGPLTNPLEMGDQTHGDIENRLKLIPGYVKLFKKLYHSEISIEHIVNAIAQFEETLISLDSPYDRYRKGEKNALTDIQKRGMKRFLEVGCTSCHSGDHFAGPQMPQGVGFYQKFPMLEGTEEEKKYQLKKDLGRFNVTKEETDQHFFRVPSLRNIALTAPYFHNGSVKELSEAVRVMAKTQLDVTLTANDIAAIVAFLESLTGRQPQIIVPKLPPSSDIKAH